MIAKRKVAPVKGLTIPKLEQQAAVMGNRSTQTNIDSYSLIISKKVLWTDSNSGSDAGREREVMREL